tara:strand:+ start:8038 stop:11028 length:2991 start_codon:yes stop_codon:yes gene_type:complete
MMMMHGQSAKKKKKRPTAKGNPFTQGSTAAKGNPFTQGSAAAPKKASPFETMSKADAIGERLAPEAVAPAAAMGAVVQNAGAVDPAAAMGTAARNVGAVDPAAAMARGAATPAAAMGAQAASSGKTQVSSGNRDGGPAPPTPAAAMGAAARNVGAVAPAAAQAAAMGASGGPKTLATGAQLDPSAVMAAAGEKQQVSTVQQDRSDYIDTMLAGGGTDTADTGDGTVTDWPDVDDRGGSKVAGRMHEGFPVYEDPNGGFYTRRPGSSRVHWITDPAQVSVTGPKKDPQTAMDEQERKNLLRQQQATVETQTGSTEAIDQRDPTQAAFSNAASSGDIPLAAETITGPQAIQGSGLNTEIDQQLSRGAALDLQSDDALRGNQQNVLQLMGQRAEEAGRAAVENLSLPDVTAVSVPERTESAMEQAIGERLTDRLTGGRFLDPQSGLTNEGEAQALRRLQQDSYLGESEGLDAAERAAMLRLEEGGRRTVPIGSELSGAAEEVIRNRLMGGENPAMAAQRARVEERYGRSMDEGREMLNRLGVLRGGDTADVFNELTRGRDQQMLDVDALGYDMQSQAIADALGYQGRRDRLESLNQELERQAIGDVSGLASQRDQRAGMEGQMRREAIGDVMPFQQRRDQISMAEQDLQRQAIGDAMTRQEGIDARDFRESELTGSLRGAATLPARLAQAGLQFDAADLQQNVADRTLARQLTQTAPTQREMFEESIRQARQGEDFTRAELTGSLVGPGGPTKTLQREFGEADRLGRLGTEDTMARTRMEDDLETQRVARGATEAGLTGRYDGRQTLAGRGQQFGEDVTSYEQEANRVSQELEIEKSDLDPEEKEALLLRLEEIYGPRMGSADDYWRDPNRPTDRYFGNRGVDRRGGIDARDDLIRKIMDQDRVSDDWEEYDVQGGMGSNVRTGPDSSQISGDYGAATVTGEDETREVKVTNEDIQAGNRAKRRRAQEEAMNRRRAEMGLPPLTGRAALEEILRIWPGG